MSAEPVACQCACRCPVSTTPAIIATADAICARLENAPGDYLFSRARYQELAHHVRLALMERQRLCSRLFPHDIHECRCSQATIARTEIDPEAREAMTAALENFETVTAQLNDLIGVCLRPNLCLSLQQLAHAQKIVLDVTDVMHAARLQSGHSVPDGDAISETDTAGHANTAFVDLRPPQVATVEDGDNDQTSHFMPEAGSATQDVPNPDSLADDNAPLEDQPAASSRRSSTHSRLSAASPHPPSPFSFGTGPGIERLDLGPPAYLRGNEGIAHDSERRSHTCPQHQSNLSQSMLSDSTAPTAFPSSVPRISAMTVNIDGPGNRVRVSQHNEQAERQDEEFLTAGIRELSRLVELLVRQQSDS